MGIQLQLSSQQNEEDDGASRFGQSTFATQSFQKGPLIYVGDSETDSLTAQNAGAIFLLFNGGYRSSSVEEIDHYAVFESHAEIPHLVERILSDVF